MPSLPEDTYCSEQICIPPSFPYLLRQYAKAAIRTQPTDLLKWSTAYFRCLSLNVPPPVKPRLEYPIPRDYNGITPGWLKALLYQLQNNLTVPFKVLWDRWIGACLQHHTLIQLLCLGGFEDAESIPFLKFVAICAGTLTDDLTHTMIMICEILTEEPEGGSAMIPLETFLNLYTFLARIDGSHDQTLRNYYFRDSLLTLWKEKVEQEEGKAFELQEYSLEAQESTMTKTSSDTACKGEMGDDVERVVSCSSLPEDDLNSIVFSLKQEKEITEKGDEGREEKGEVFDEMKEAKEEGSVEEKSCRKRIAEDQEDAADKHAEKETVKAIEGEEHEAKSHEGSQKGEVEDEAKKGKIVVEETAKEPEEEATQPKTGKEPAEKHYESVETITDQPVRDREHGSEDVTLQEGLEHLRAQQQELVKKTADEVGKFKRGLIEEMPFTQSQEEGVKQFVRNDEEAGHMQTNEENLKIVTEEDPKSEDVNSVRRENVLEEKDKRPYDDVYVESIKGIGPTVSVALTKSVIAYMKNCAKQQHGMVMPRNITHYSCPPLEGLDY
ncbi:neurofilament medium polypeptide-like [Euwallacea similis]|uniref:neurofilament medium polypeptide-like n=1 Tax=Euwallacea similis TaxID=1736056 RepID=UPI00344E008D